MFMRVNGDAVAGVDGEEGFLFVYKSDWSLG